MDSEGLHQLPSGLCSHACGECCTGQRKEARFRQLCLKAGFVKVFSISKASCEVDENRFVNV